MMAPFLPPRSRILVVSMRRLGDVLLTTPLIRTLRRAYPDAAIDLLAFRGTEGIVAGNPDLRSVISIAERPSLGDTLAAIRRVARRYDLAICTQAGDRPTLLTLLAAPQRVGLVAQSGGGAFWKRRLLQWSVVASAREHRVESAMRLADALGLQRLAEVVPPSPAWPAEIDLPRRYAVFHTHPKFRYKEWPAERWRALAVAMIGRGLDVVATGSADPAEQADLDHVWNHTPVRRLDGRLDWQALTAVLSKAEVYVGPDTSVTHLAAAVGCPTIALFGPTDPRLWGPIPQGGLDRAWQAAEACQRRGNVWLVQNVLPCTPCQEEGCERHLASTSACLDRMQAEPVLSAIEEALSVLHGGSQNIRGEDAGPP